MQTQAMGRWTELQGEQGTSTSWKTIPRAWTYVARATVQQICVCGLYEARWTVGQVRNPFKRLHREPFSYRHDSANYTRHRHLQLPMKCQGDKRLFSSNACNAELALERSHIFWGYKEQLRISRIISPAIFRQLAFKRGRLGFQVAGALGVSCARRPRF
jgi:hypothetical protein